MSTSDNIQLASSLKDIEVKLDSQAEKQAKRSSLHDKGSSSASKPINVAPKPTKTTVGFGPGSLTKHHTPTEQLASSPSTNQPKKSKQPQSQQQQHPKKPKLTKKERRELQEKQRAEKAARLASEGTPRKSSVNKKPRQVASKMIADDEKKQKTISKKLAKMQVPVRTTSQKQVGFFSHLHQYERSADLTKDIPFSKNALIHPSIVRLGLQMAEGHITGSTERCVALLLAMKNVIEDYTTPAGKELPRDLNSALEPCISFLGQCRTMSASMGNAIKYLKFEITHTDPTFPEDKAKEHLLECIDRYINERIVLAQTAISKLALSKIQDGDVILVHGFSSLLLNIFSEAVDKGVDFRVVVVDSRPKCRGRRMLARLVELEIDCSYAMINALSYVMTDVSKVFLAAHALLANGYVMSRVGSSMIAMMAKANNVPVLLCCETFKFCERVQTDAFVFNELGDPDDLLNTEPSQTSQLSNWKEKDNLKLLNLVMDVTPPEFVDIVITEIGMIPCSSVPVVLRVREENK